MRARVCVCVQCTVCIWCNAFPSVAKALFRTLSLSSLRLSSEIQKKVQRTHINICFALILYTILYVAALNYSVPSEWHCHTIDEFNIHINDKSSFMHTNSKQNVRELKCISSNKFSYEMNLLDFFLFTLHNWIMARKDFAPILNLVSKISRLGDDSIYISK